MQERDDFKDRVKDATDIVEYIEQNIPLDTPLRRTSGVLQTRCMFHEEKTPSFTIYPDGQHYFCFGCHRGGDIFTLVMEYNGLDFPDALELLAKRANIPIPTSAGQKQRKQEQDQLSKILEHACRLFQGALPGSYGEKYIHDRGVSSESIDVFQLGYTPKTQRGENFIQDQLEKIYGIELLIRAGLLKDDRDRGRGIYDFFWDERVIFPIHNDKGVLVAFTGRRLDKEKQAKYLNSPETSLFHKKKVLYGLPRAINTIKQTKSAGIVEGTLDVILSHQTGLENIVAPCGTALTEEQIRLLKRKCRDSRLILIFDGDEPGKNAALRAAEKTLGRLTTDVCILPEKEDPASLIASGREEEYRTLLNTASPLFEFCLEHYTNGLDLSIGDEIYKALQNTRELLSKIPKTSRGPYIAALSTRTNIPTHSIESALEQVENPIVVERAQAEKQFLQAVLRNASQVPIQYFSQYITPETFTPKVQAFWSYLQQQKPEFFTNLQTPSQQTLPDRLSDEFQDFQKTISTLGINPRSKKPNLKELEHAFINVSRTGIGEDIDLARGEKSMPEIIDIINRARKMLK